MRSQPADLRFAATTRPGPAPNGGATGPGQGKDAVTLRTNSRAQT